MRDVVQKLGEMLRADQPVAYCRLVETRGSTPQKAGEMMLVFPDGSQAGALGGGCVEAEVKRRALTVLQQGEAEITTFQLDSDYGWDDGLICGGRMKILIDPLRDAGSAVYISRLCQAVEEGVGVTEAVVFDREASGLPSPSSYLFNASEELIASTQVASTQVASTQVASTQVASTQVASTQVASTEGPVEAEPPAVVVDQLRPLATRPRPYAASGVGYLPSQRRCRLLIVGGGHVGKAVADLAADLDFNIWVVDDREEFVSVERFPRAERRVAGKIETVLPEIDITPDTYCLIVTRGHNHDEEALYYLVNRGACYVGLIGSRRKIKMIFDDLVNEGISEEALEQVYAPLGIDIGSQTVPEIAVSICAELVSHRNRGGVVPGRPAAVRLGGVDGCHT